MSNANRPFDRRFFDRTQLMALSFDSIIAIARQFK